MPGDFYSWQLAVRISVKTNEIVARHHLIWFLLTFHARPR